MMRGYCKLSQAFLSLKLGMLVDLLHPAQAWRSEAKLSRARVPRTDDDKYFIFKCLSDILRVRPVRDIYR
jgi:hypothetical protein